MWKYIQGVWIQIPTKRINTKPTAWLQTPAKCRLYKTITASFTFLATRVATVESEFSISFRIALAAHS
jgi:hypothetical protein